jgi:predicted TIM-barrel enzyme
MPFIPRAELVARLQATIDAGIPIVGAGAGTGLSAKMAEAGGADMAIIYNSGRYRMAGRGSLAGMLAYGDANGIVVEMAAEVLPVVSRMAVLAGINGTDPFRIMRVFLGQLRALGFDGVQNFPTVGLIDGEFRRNLEATGMGTTRRSRPSPRRTRRTCSPRPTCSTRTRRRRWSRRVPTSSWRTSA